MHAHRSFRRIRSVYVDAQLYAKYGLADDDIEFNESNVPPME